MTSSDASEDELLEWIAALEEENKRLRVKLRWCEGPHTPPSKQQSSGDGSSPSDDEDDGSPRTDDGSPGRNPGHDPAYRDAPDPDREVEVTCECCPERGEDFDEHLSRDDCFDAAADFLGQDWLNAQVETFRDSPSSKTAPRPVKNYRRARKELGYVEDEFESHFLETSIPVLEFLNLGRYVLLLRESRADIVHPASFDVFNTTLNEHFATDLRNRNHYQRALYELQTGYFHACQGYTVQFLAGKNPTSKTPNILLRTPFKVFVECRRVDAVGSDVQEAESIAGELTERTAAHLDPGHVAVFECSSEPKMGDIGGVTGDIQSSTWDEPTTNELPSGTVTVFNLTTAFGENGVWLADDGKSVMSEHEEVCETYVQPLVERVAGEELSLRWN